MTDELKSAVDRLRSISPKLNQATDEANRTVQLVENFLNDECKLGLTLYVESPDLAPENGVYRDLGYDRAGGKFRIVIKTDDCRDEDGAVQYDSEQIPVTTKLEIMPWSSCPRGLKLKSMKYLPELLQNLAGEAEEAIGSASKAIKAIKSIVTAIRPEQAQGLSNDKRQIAIEAGDMYSAVTANHETQINGFLDRETGNVCWLHENPREPGTISPKTVLEWEADRSMIEENPDRYIQIPKFDHTLYAGKSHRDRDSAMEDFITSFLEEHAIDAVMK